MRRRDAMALVGSAAAWPRAVLGQGDALPVIGFLHPGPNQSHVAAFREGLADAGFSEGQNAKIDYRSAEGQFERLPGLAAELVGRRVQVIVTPSSTAATLAAKAATQSIPIVFGIPEDPVRFGLVVSMARPGGNATGVNFLVLEVISKRLQILRELLPKAERVAVLVNPSNAANTETTLREIGQAAPPLGLQLQVVHASSGVELDGLFRTLADQRLDAVFVGGDPFLNTLRAELASLAASYAIPASYAVRDYVEAGGLMSYGPSIHDMFRQVGTYAGRILKGEKPSDLPVVQAVKIELVINLKTASTLGLTIPPTLLARADEVIE